jgi:TRAP-type C4-dicarboxylate transport system permease small subunit
MADVEATQAVAGEVMSPRRRSPVAAFEATVGKLVEIPAALLVVAEIVTLFAGVVARYVVQQPLIWSDELASILFLWLAMLGSVVAFRRSEHMRMTAVVAGVRPSMRAFLEVVATCAALAFLLLIVAPSCQYAYEESFITTPALQISNSWRAAALPVGICLMGLFAVLRLAGSAIPPSSSRRRFRWRCWWPCSGWRRRGCGRSAILIS